MIEIKNLNKSFGKNHILKGINTHIDKGQVVVVIGPSGSGKSTFLRCLNLLECPEEGDIIFEGEDIKRFAAKWAWSFSNLIFFLTKLFWKT